jgi:hypothetical protein
LQHGIRLSEDLDGDGESIFRHACTLGAEGIVAKRRDRPYRSGRCADWVKIKNPDAGSDPYHRMVVRHGGPGGIRASANGRMAQAAQGGRRCTAVADDRDRDRGWLRAAGRRVRGLPPIDPHTLEEIKRPPETPLADLAERLVCKRCGKGGPLPRIAGVSRQVNGFGARGVRAPLPSDRGG